MASARTEVAFNEAWAGFQLRWPKSKAYFEKTWMSNDAHKRWAQPWLRDVLTFGRISSSEAESSNQCVLAPLCVPADCVPGPVC